MDFEKIDFDSIDVIKSFGFKGFLSIRQLTFDSSYIPKQKGVYFILRNQPQSPKYLATGTGGFFKGKNPNVTIQELEKNWVDGCKVIYIGKAGASNKKATIQTRLRQYIKFGLGKNVGHYGGRFIWQLSDAKDLIVCWKELFDEEPLLVENKIINIFKEKYGKRPFANLKG